ncbi:MULTISPECIES: hypothetical protein [Aliivibrio]|uniref:Uncharacterized protein n=2 Tax=Aliivibrio logei TaxID=688 RepID=A0A1B9P2T2_ALILO|nr:MULTISPECIES: hypothetical protein [Aliivibrio]MBB1312238.1 hypothetical protein [Aliivibrio sp. SR45-2]OCH22659.1 hypothetical protein A6E04_06030 [Aliivibrio logei]OEF22821.1 hypothetical protein A1Q5_03265 [Aliivibrio logei 5S-186]
MNNKGIISVVILLIMAAIFTSGLIRAMIELSIFSILIGYVLLEKKKKTNHFPLNDKKPDK